LVGVVCPCWLSARFLMSRSNRFLPVVDFFLFSPVPLPFGKPFWPARGFRSVGLHNFFRISDDGSTVSFLSSRGFRSLPLHPLFRLGLCFLPYTLVYRVRSLAPPRFWQIPFFFRLKGQEARFQKPGMLWIPCLFFFQESFLRPVDACSQPLLVFPSYITRLPRCSSCKGVLSPALPPCGPPRFSRSCCPVIVFCAFFPWTRPDFPLLSGPGPRPPFFFSTVLFSVIDFNSPCGSSFRKGFTPLVFSKRFPAALAMFGLFFSPAIWSGHFLYCSTCHFFFPTPAHSFSPIKHSMPLRG